MEHEEKIKDLRKRAKELELKLVILNYSIAVGWIIGIIIVNEYKNLMGVLIVSFIFCSMTAGLVIILFTLVYYLKFLSRLLANKLSFNDYLKRNKKLKRISKRIYLIISPLFIYVFILSLINASLAFFILFFFMLLTVVLIPICELNLYKYIENKYALLMELNQKKEGPLKYRIGTEDFDTDPVRFVIARNKVQIGEKEYELEKTERETRLQEHDLKQEVQKELDPKIKELESYLTKSIDKNIVKNYKFQINNLTKEKNVKLNIKLRNITKDKSVQVESIKKEIEFLKKKQELLEELYKSR